MGHIKDLEKTFVIQRRLGGQFNNYYSLPWNWKTPRASWINSNVEAQLPAHISSDEDQDVFLHLYVGMKPSAITNPVLRIQLSENEGIEVRINGSLVAYPTTIEHNWYEYVIFPDMLAEGDNLIQVALSHSITESKVWIEKVELSIK